MRLAGGVFNDGHAVGQHGGQHDVHGSAHRDNVQIDLGAAHPSAPALGVDKSAADIHIGAHGHKALDVLVDGTHAEIATAGHGHLGTAKAAQQGADQVVGGADLPGQHLGHLPVVDMGTVDLHGGAVDGAYIGAQLLKNVQDQRHIGDLGNIFNPAHPIHQQGGGYDGDSGVFRTADLDLSVQRLTAANQILCQSCTLYSGREPPARNGRKGLVVVLQSQCPAAGHAHLHYSISEM